MTMQKRLHNFLEDLNRYMTCDITVLDFDENGDCIYDEDENDVYLEMMSTDEWHLLGTETVKHYIHLWFTDWSTMSTILEREHIY